MSDLLALARAQLNDGDAGANRRACWLARSAMEEAIDDLLLSRGVDAGPRASTRAKLTCLEVAYEDEPRLAARAQYTWARLSEACHHHAYQLSPTASEAKQLVASVALLTSSPEALSASDGVATLAGPEAQGAESMSFT